MAKFTYEGQSNPGDGSKNPIERKVKRALFNAKVKITQNQLTDAFTVEKLKKI